MGLTAMLNLNLRIFSLLKSLLEINFNQMTMNSLVSPFGLTGSTIATIDYANSEDRSNLL